MTETEILNLYWQRSEKAIEESEIKFGKYCFAIAFGILSNSSDADESVNDTWLAGWNSMPPKRPNSLKAYLGKLCRHISLSKLRKRMAQKRGGGEALLAIEELGECLSDGFDVQQSLELKELSFKLNIFLSDLADNERNVFVARYWYALPIADIALKFSIPENTVKTKLRRSREKLRHFLEKEGY